MERLLSTLQGKSLATSLGDRVVWKEMKNGIFSIKSLYNTLDPSCVVCFRGASFGALVFLLRWVFLLGKLHRGRS